MKPGSLSYRAASFFFRRILFRIRVEGEENEPEAGGVLLCSNHISDFDPILLSAVTKRIARFMAKKELFRIPLLRGIVKSFGAFPVNRGHADTASLKHCLALLREGDLVGIFPEGTRFPGAPPAASHVKGGLGMLALRSGAPILPVCIITKNFRIRLFSKITVRIGALIPPEEYLPGELSPSEYDRVSKLAFERVIALATDGGGTAKA